MLIAKKTSRTVYWEALLVPDSTSCRRCGELEQNAIVVPVRLFWLVPVLVGCITFFSVPLRALSSDCIKLNSAIKQAADRGQIRQAQHVALQSLGEGAGHLEAVCAGVILNNAAVLARLSGNFDEAQRLAKQSIEQFRQVLPPEDPIYLRPLHLLAAIFLTQGSTGKARETLRRMERIQVTSPEDRALVLEISASLLQREGKLKEAEEDYRSALLAIFQSGKQNSADMAAVQRSLAYLYVQEHRYREASEMVDVALATMQRAGDAVPLDRIQILNVRATASAHEARWREAEADLKDAVSLARAQSAIDPIELEPVVTNYAQVLRKLHRKKARSVERWATALRSETGPSRLTIDIAELLHVSK